MRCRVAIRPATTPNTNLRPLPWSVTHTDRQTDRQAGQHMCYAEVKVVVGGATKKRGKKKEARHSIHIQWMAWEYGVLLCPNEPWEEKKGEAENGIGTLSTVKQHQKKKRQY